MIDNARVAKGRTDSNRLAFTFFASWTNQSVYYFGALLADIDIGKGFTRRVRLTSKELLRNRPVALDTCNRLVA